MSDAFKWVRDPVNQNRMLLMRGKVAVGAVFLPYASERYFRWRAWCTCNMNPIDGVDRTLETAKSNVEDRFKLFLLATGLTAGCGGGAK